MTKKGKKTYIKRKLGRSTKQDQRTERNGVSRKKIDIALVSITLKEYKKTNEVGEKDKARIGGG